MDVIGVLAYIVLGAALWAIIAHVRSGNRRAAEARLAREIERETGK